jgi:glutamine cyclotransferase
LPLPLYSRSGVVGLGICDNFSFFGLYLSVLLMKPFVFLMVVALGFLVASCGRNSDSSRETPVDSLALSYSVLKTLPHDPEAYTEGLLIYKGKVLESTGLNGKSWVAEVDPGSGVHTKKIVLDGQYFGEGISVINNKLYQLTYKSKVGFIYDATTYKQVGQFNFSNAEGWGMTHDNKNLIMSDGTEKLTYLDTANLSVVRTLTVTNEGQKLKNVNELEYVDGYIYANVYETSWIVKIDAASGKVVGRADLSPLTEEVRRMYPNIDYLNGIAYDVNSKAFLVTGKNWPKAFLIRIQKPAAVNP